MFQAMRKDPRGGKNEATERQSVGKARRRRMRLRAAGVGAKVATEWNTSENARL